MSYDPQRHHRRSIRVKGYDYTQPGAYFVTICVHQRVCLLGTVLDGAMQPSDYGASVVACWNSLVDRFPTFEPDAFVVMPNHIHGIIVLRAAPATTANGEARPPTLGQVVAYFKYQTTREINVQRRTPGMALWQRNYYEHIVRGEAELERLRTYIANNPLQWSLDQLHPDNSSL